MNGFSIKKITDVLSRTIKTDADMLC